MSRNNMKSLYPTLSSYLVTALTISPDLANKLQDLGFSDCTWDDEQTFCLPLGRKEQKGFAIEVRSGRTYTVQVQPPESREHLSGDIEVLKQFKDEDELLKFVSKLVGDIKNISKNLHLHYFYKARNMPSHIPQIEIDKQQTRIEKIKKKQSET